MTASESFHVWNQRLHTNEDDAAREVFERFARRLEAMVRRRCGHALGGRVEAEDVVQSAVKSFFVRHRKGGLRLGDWDGVWSLLALIARRKCLDRVEYLRAERRDVAREARWADPQEAPWDAAVDREPRPEESAALVETVAELFGQMHEDDRPILELSLQGYSAAEIGARLGRALRSVQRLREQIRARLERRLLDGLSMGLA